MGGGGQNDMFVGVSPSTGHAYNGNNNDILYMCFARAVAAPVVKRPKNGYRIKYVSYTSGVCVCVYVWWRPTIVVHNRHIYTNGRWRTGPPAAGHCIRFFTGRVFPNPRVRLRLLYNIISQGPFSVIILVRLLSRLFITTHNVYVRTHTPMAYVYILLCTTIIIRSRAHFQ